MSEKATGLSDPALGRVLMVDDEADLCMLVNEHLKDGYLVETFTDPEEAWLVQEASPFDVLVLDLRMPRLDGLEFLRRVRATEAETEVVILTGNASLDSAMEAIDLGIFAYCNKPIRFDQLRVVVDRAWQTLRLRQQNRKLTADLAEANRKLGEEVETLARSLADRERAAALGQGLAALAVRLQEPVERIVGMARLHDDLLGDLPAEVDGKALRGFTERIRETCERLTDHLEGLAVLGSERVPVAGEEASLVPTVQLAVEEARRTHGTVDFRFSAPSEALRVPHRPRFVRKALAELFFNAVSAGRGESVEVALERAGSKVLVVVRNRGGGLSDEARRGIGNEDFYTSDSSKKVGLGLSVVRKVMADHGGRMRFTNLVDEGTEFALVFPGCTD